VLATLLVTDIVDSTARALELGDGPWRDLLARHDQAVRAVLDRFRGREVATTGDGFVAMFDGAERAIHAAQEIGRVASRIGLGSGPRSTPARSSPRASGGLADRLH
jgi:class 3 adenylate cyclase